MRVTVNKKRNILATSSYDNSSSNVTLYLKNGIAIF